MERIGFPFGKWRFPYSWGSPSPLDGLFHGKSENKMDDLGVPKPRNIPDSGNGWLSRVSCIVDPWYGCDSNLRQREKERERVDLNASLLATKYVFFLLGM